MNYDTVVVPDKPRYAYDEDYYYRERVWSLKVQEIIGLISFHDSVPSISCAFSSVRGTWGTTEDKVWKQLCYVIGKAKQTNKPVLIPVTDKEPLAVQLLQSCPYVKYICKGKSKHGSYQSYIFIMEVTE